MATHQKEFLRVVQLIRLATDPAASEAEARTAAMIACRMIREHRLLLAKDFQETPGKERPTPTDVWEDPEKGERVSLRSKYEGRCKRCRQKYYIGTEVLWSPSGFGCIHPNC